MLSSRGKRTKKETLGEEHCKHVRSWEEKPSGEWRCWASLPRVVPRGAERPSPRSTPTGNLCQALLQLTTRTITCFLHTLSALEMSLSSKLVKCSKNLISFQSCLGRCANNQNGNLRWHLPWRGRGGVSRGSRVPHTYSEIWFFWKPFRIIPWLLKRVLHLVWALYYVYIVVEMTLNMAK